MENSKLLTILVEVDEGTKTPFKAHNEILSLFGVVKSFYCAVENMRDGKRCDYLCGSCINMQS